MATKSSRKSAAKKKSFQKRILISVLGGIAALIVVAIVIVNIVNHHTESTADRAITEARQQYTPQFDSHRAQQIDALTRVGIIDTSAKAYSSKVDVCYIDSGGSFGSSYFQQCYVRYMDLLPTKLDAGQTFGSLSAITKKSSLIGKTENWFRALDQGGCRELYRLDQEAVIGEKVRYPRTISRTFYVSAGVERNKYLDSTAICTGMTPERGNYVRIAVPTVVGDLAAHPHRTFSLDEIDTTHTYVLIETDNIYYHETLECKPASVFCEPVRKKVATGEW